MRVAELMTPDPLTVRPDMPLVDAVGHMFDLRVRHLPVVEAEELIGLVSERDLLEATGWDPGRYVEHHGGPKIVRDFMSVPVETVREEDDVVAAIDLLVERGLGCVPVRGERSEKQIVGVLSVTDLLAEYVRAYAEEERAAELDRRVGEVATANPLKVDVAVSVADALELARAHQVRHLPVLGEEWFVGLVSDRDLRLHVGRDEEHRPVEEIMTREVATVSPAARLSEAASTMLHGKVESLPVTRDGRLVGMLTATDVLTALREQVLAAAVAER